MDTSTSEEDDILKLHPRALWLDFTEEDTCDMTLRISGQRIHCKKYILLPRCGFFRRLCKYVDKPRHMYIDMEAFPGGIENFQTILKFCYGNRIDLVADIRILYLSHGATFLGMNRSVMFDEDNLAELCDRFWQDYMLSSWRSVFKTLALLQQARMHLSISHINGYMQKCKKALCMLVKSLHSWELDDFMKKLVLLPEYQLDVIISGLRTVWLSCQQKALIDSCVLAAHSAAPWQAGALYVVAMSLAKGHDIPCVYAEEKENEFRAVKKEHGSLLVFVPSIVYILMMLDAIPLKLEPVMRLRRNIFKLLLPKSLGTSSPELALKLIRNFIEDECKLLCFDHIGTNLLLKYFYHCRSSLYPFPFSLFLKFAKALSLVLKDSHNQLYDEVKLYCKEASLSRAEKEELEHLVNCAALSSDRLKEVIVSDFSCSLGDVALALKKENEELKDDLTKKRRRDSCSSCLLDSQTPSKISRSLEDGEVENDMPNNSVSLEMCESDKDSHIQIMKNIDEHEEEDVKPKDPFYMLCPSDLSKEFYISIMTTEYKCLSFPMDLFDEMALVKKKILEEVEANSLKLPSHWHLMYKGKKVVESATLHVHGIEMYGVIQMQGCWSAKEEEPRIQAFFDTPDAAADHNSGSDVRHATFT